MTRVYNEDCISGAPKHIADQSVDLMICDPPFGVGGDTLHKHYNRDENVFSGYVEAPPDYYQFSKSWLEQAKRVLKDTGSMYVVSGWTNLGKLLRAVEDIDFYLINHVIWKYNFGVYTRKKYVSSHYHVLYLKKSKTSKVGFNTNCRFPGGRSKDGSPLYRDLEDVWTINKEYHPGKIKNKNKLPDVLVEKMIAYSSDPGEVVCDFFLGNFTVALAAKRMGREPVGFEINPESFNHSIKKL